jgi:L-rhamnose-H+ transport protein
LWGIGGLTFGLTLRYLGMSLGMAVSLGLCATFGTLVPPLVHGQFGQLLSTTSGCTVLAGVGVCLAGIGLIGSAGIRKEREMAQEQKQKSVTEFSLAKGFLTAVIAGGMSSFMAFGMDAARPIGLLAVELNIPQVYRNAPVLILVMSGNFTTNLIWCLALNLKNRSVGDYLRGPRGLLLSYYFFAAMAGVLAYSEFFWYGMGTTQMGKYDFSSWSIHLAFVIVFSTIWGIYFQEWKGVGVKPWLYVCSGILVLILSTIVIGAGNTISTATT